MMAIQTEYRRNIYKWRGAVALVGTASIWGNKKEGEEDFERTWLPSTGIGDRFMILREKNKFKIGLCHWSRY